MNCGKLYGLLTAEERKWIVTWMRKGATGTEGYENTDLCMLPFVPIEVIKEMTNRHHWSYQENIDIGTSIRAKIRKLK